MAEAHDDLERLVRVAGYFRLYLVVMVHLLPWLAERISVWFKGAVVEADHEITAVSIAEREQRPDQLGDVSIVLQIEPSLQLYVQRLDGTRNDLVRSGVSALFLLALGHAIT